MAVLPRGYTLSREDVESIFALQQTPPVIAGVPVSYLVPRTWEEVDVTRRDAEGIDHSRLVAMWVGDIPDPEGRAQLQLFRAEFDHDISAANWLRRFASGLKIVVHEMDAVSPHVADAVISMIVGPATVSGRLCVRFYGREILAVLASDIAARFEQTVEWLALMVRGASAEGMSPGGAVEPRQSVRIGHHLTVQLPASWTKVDVPGPNPLLGITDAQRKNEDGAVLSQLRFKWLHLHDSEIDVADEIGKLRAEAIGAGYQFIERTFAQTGDDDAKGQAPRLIGQQIESATDPEGKPCEITTIAIESPGQATFVRAITPSRDAAFEEWAIGRRALEIALETIKAV